MAVFNDNDRLLKYRYKVSALQIIFPNEEPKTLLNERLKSIDLLYDYENNAYPIFKINILLESSLYYKIHKYKDKVKFRLRVQKYYNTVDGASRSLNRDFINDTFNLILDDEQSDLTISTKKSQNKMDYTKIVADDDGDLRDSDNMAEFFLFNTNIIKGLNNTNVNAILTDCNVVDAVAYIMNKAKIRNVLMTPPENLKKKDTILIPPGNCLNALKFIDTYYGIYRKGSMIFFGLSNSYILSYDGECTAYTDNEKRITNIIIPSTNSTHDTPGVISKSDDDKSNYIIADYRTVNIYNDAITNDVVTSNNIQFIDSLSGVVRKSKSKLALSESYKIQENVTENEWLGDTYIAQVDAIGNIVNVLLQDYDENMLSPNKKFNLIFEDSNMTKTYNGTYMLCSVNHKLIKDGDDFTINTSITLKRSK